MAQSLPEKVQPRKLILNKFNGDENKKAITIATSCIEWFNEHPDSLDVFVRTIRRQEGFSLRIIDWTITNFSKRRRITTFYKGLPIDLHNDYRRYLGVFTKRYFDPFARRERVDVLVAPQKEHLSTTIGQLNFMKWLLERDLHLTILNARDDIETDMRQYEGGKRHHADAQTRPLAYSGTFHLHF
jgi:hypothetical protein